MLFTNFKNKKILVTGNTGFKGSWLTLILLKQGAKVYGISKSVPTVPSLYEILGLKDEIHQITADLCEPSIVAQIESIQPDIIFHLAAQSITTEAIREPRYTIENNLSATISVLEYLRKSVKHCTALFVTSDKCYENQESLHAYTETDVLGGKEPYGASKAVCEIVYASYFQTYFKSLSSIKTATVRSGNVIGGGDFAMDRIIPDCIRSWQKGQPVEIRNQDSIRPWLHVIEPLAGYMMLCDSLIENSEFDGQSFNLGPSRNELYTVSNVVKGLALHFSYKLPEPLYSRAIVKEDHEASLLRINSDKAEQCLGWKPKLNFQESVKLTAQWYDQFLNDPSQIRSLMDKQIDSYFNS